VDATQTWSLSQVQPQTSFASTLSQVQVRFPGTGKRHSHQVTERQNIDSPVRPGKTYRRVFARTRITSRLLEDGLD
jgi:hypothetical protein